MAPLQKWNPLPHPQLDGTMYDHWLLAFTANDLYARIIPPPSSAVKASQSIL